MTNVNRAKPCRLKRTGAGPVRLGSVRPSQGAVNENIGEVSAQN